MIASAWEAQCVAELRPRCAKMARSINGLAHLGLSSEDACQILLLAVVEACRGWAERESTRPPPAFLNCALRNRRIKLWKKIRVRAVNKYAVESEARAEIEATILPDTVESIGTRKAAQAIAQALSLKLSPTDFALLSLRARGKTPEDIATILKISDFGNIAPNTLVSHRLLKARRKAMKFLRSYGIDTFENIEDVTPESLGRLFDEAFNSND